MRALVVFAPILLVAGFVAVRALLKRPLSRRALDILVALTLLAYLCVTAALGLFWVARMDLPVFDWHYLFGYALLVVAAVHVSLQLRGLARFFRRRLQPKSAAPRPAVSGFRWSPAAALVGAGVVGFALGALLVNGRTLSVATNFSPPNEPEQPMHDGPRIVDKLYAESSYSRAGVLRKVALAPPRPPEVKTYPGHARQKLPDAKTHAGMSWSAALSALRDSETPEPRSHPTLRDVSALLFHTNGATASGPGYTLRAAASSGALYPTDVYLLAQNVEGLVPGAYYYSGPTHELVHIGDEKVLTDVRASLPDLPGLDRAPFLVVFGTTFDRTAWKYTVRTYRYLALDAGHAALNLVAAATTLAVPCVSFAGFDDRRFGAALALPPKHETPLLAFACGMPTSPPRLPISPHHETAAWPKNAAEIELTRLSSAVTSWSLRAGFKWLDPPTKPPAPAPVTLVRADPAGGDLFQVIRARRSFREFESRAVSQRAFAGVLADATSFLGYLRGVPLIELYVAVRAVDDIEPGTYRYDAERGALSRALRPERPVIESAGLDQALLGRAAFVLAWSLMDERAGHLEGARDFRHAALEAGLAGEAAYLSASARGLGICGVGAFYDDEVAELFAREGSGPRVLYLMGVGAR